MGILTNWSLISLTDMQATADIFSKTELDELD